MARSKTLILVKNLHADTTEDELCALFRGYGQLAQTLLTPSSTLGLVEFLEVGEARRAFRSLAYHKHRGVPIYLELAPTGLLQPNAPTGSLGARSTNAAGGGGGATAPGNGVAAPGAKAGAAALEAAAVGAAGVARRAGRVDTETAMGVGKVAARVEAHAVGRRGATAAREGSWVATAGTVATAA